MRQTTHLGSIAENFKIPFEEFQARYLSTPSSRKYAYYLGLTAIGYLGFYNEIKNFNAIEDFSPLGLYAGIGILMACAASKNTYVSTMAKALCTTIMAVGLSTLFFAAEPHIPAIITNVFSATSNIVPTLAKLAVAGLTNAISEEVLNAFGL